MDKGERRQTNGMRYGGNSRDMNRDFGDDSNQSSIINERCENRGRGLGRGGFRGRGGFGEKSCYERRDIY